MRTLGLVGMGACVAALTGALHAGADRPAAEPAVRASAALRSPMERVEPIRIRVQASTLAPPAPTPIAAPPAPTPPATPRVEERPGTRDDRDLRRDNRRRGNNRYPGPIPSPADWSPPDGPVRIGLQAGHWRADEAPRELEGLKGNGTRWEGVAEWQANLEIARRAAAMLEERGYVVDVLPAVVPPGYRSHLFISIHADGSNDPSASGYRVAAPRRDATGRANRAARLLERSYGEATGLTRLPTVTRRMQNYYAFNYRRYEHALHPMTIGVILETGFLTSARDRRVIMDDPDRAARGIVEAVTAFPETPAPAAAAGNQ